MTQEPSPLNELMEEYREVQQRVLMWGQNPLPDHIPASEWRKTRTDSFRDQGFCSRAIRDGRLPGAIKIGKDWMIPRGLKPLPLPRTPRDPDVDRDGLSI